MEKAFDHRPSEESFIEFGDILNRSKRKEIVELLLKSMEGRPIDKQRVAHEAQEKAELLTSSQAVMDQISKAPELIPEIMDRTLGWLEKDLPLAQAGARQKLMPEQTMLEGFKKLPPEHFIQQIPEIEEYLRKSYPPENLDLDFFKDKVQEWESHRARCKQMKQKVKRSSLLSGFEKGLEDCGFNELKNLEADLNSFLNQPLEAAENAKEKLSELRIQKRLAKQAPKVADPQKLSRAFLGDWRQALQGRMDQAAIDAIDKARKEYLSKLYKEIEEYLKLAELLGPFSNALGRGLDLSSGNWARTGFDVLRQYADLLKRDETLQELVKTLGRMREAEVELEEEEYQIALQRIEWRPDPRVPSEVVGIKESRDLDHLLPGEAALLADPETELLFLKKYAEGKLLTYKLEGKEKVSHTEEETTTREKATPLAKGPFILCVDTSGSMHGKPEEVAKILAFAIIRIALKEERKAYLINFSTGIQTIELTDFKRSLDHLVDFLRMSFGGGTDATPALSEALRMLNTKKFEKADVLMVSDFVMGSFSKPVMNGMAAAREKGTAFMGLTIANAPNPQVQGAFDHNWVYNFRDRGSLKRILRNIRATNSRDSNGQL